MLDYVETMFDNVPNMLKKLKKKTYESNMQGFLAHNTFYLNEMTDYVNVSADKESASSQVAEILINAVEERFIGKNGKIKSRQQADLNFYMIYYVFPAILLTEDEYAEQIVDAICSAWRIRFKDSNISYTDYNSLYNTFNEKILGIF